MQHVLVWRILLGAAVFAGAGAEAGSGAARPAEDAASPGAPAGEWIVFSSSRSGEGDLYAVDPRTGEEIAVLKSPAPEGTVRFDPARARLVWHVYEESRAMLVSGGGTLFECPNGEMAPAWSPDGEWIVYGDERDGRENLFLARPDGSDERRLTDVPVKDRYPAWSPDGKRVVFARRLESGWDLHVRGIDKSDTAERLTDDGVYVGHPAWSPDGTRIAFDTLIDGQAEIAMLHVGTGQITRLTERAGHDLVPAWSGDGRLVAFAGEPDGAGNWDVWTVDVESRELERRTAAPSWDGGPVFVPASVVGR